VGRALTPQYASPERVRAQPLTRSTDVYSLGVLLYVLLAGRMPYDLTQRSAADAERMICGEIPPRPSTVVDVAAAQSRGESQRDLQRRLAGDLDAIVMTAVSKSPADRHPTARALADDIQRHLDGLPLTVARSAHAGLAKRRGGLLAAAVLALCTLAGLLVFHWPSSQTVAAGGPKSIAILPLANTSGDAELDYLADGVTKGSSRGCRVRRT
jgi:hypothetical protein